MVTRNATNSNENDQVKMVIDRNLREGVEKQREVALVMVTRNVFQTLIDLKKKLLAILFVRQKGFNREGPVE